VAISAHSILHDFTPGPWREATRALSPAQLEVLAPGGRPPGDPPARGELAALPGVSSVQTAPIIRTLKRTGSVR